MQPGPTESTQGPRDQQHSKSGGITRSRISPWPGKWGFGTKSISEGEERASQLLGLRQGQWWLLVPDTPSGCTGGCQRPPSQRHGLTGSSATAKPASTLRSPHGDGRRADLRPEHGVTAPEAPTRSQCLTSSWRYTAEGQQDPRPQPQPP